MTSRGNHVDELISASLTGDLTDAERAELDAHLARCERCRATLTAFKSERRILSGLPVAGAPRDLSAHVRAGIESGRLGQPWWRRPSGLIAIGASVATVAAAILAIVVFGKFQFGPVGQASGSPEATLSFTPSASAVASEAPSVSPTTPPTFLAAGQLGYLSLNGGSLEPSRLTFVNDATGASIDAGIVSGPPIASSLSPDGQWLGYITRKGESGANEVWALHLTDGAVTHVGCSSAAPFTDRIVWSPDSHYLAFTLAGVAIGPDQGCEAQSNGTDVWLFDTTTSKRSQFTTAGNAYAADFGPALESGEGQLWVSFAMEMPQSALLPVPGSGAGRETGEQAPGVFLPLFSGDGNRALFWSGTMASSGGIWQFSLGGMPQLSGDFRTAGPASPWVGTPLFSDLTPVGGEAFAYGNFEWGTPQRFQGAAGDQFAFWNGAWTGAPQSADGSYPSQTDVVASSLTGGPLSAETRMDFYVLPEGAWIVDVAIDPDALAITIGLPSAGIGDPPSAYLKVNPFDGNDPYTIGGGVNPPPWDGPAVFGW